jgi:KipI family sensor histidine kinase inhibitor
MGDAGLLCEFGDLTTVHRVRAALVAAAYEGVVDVVPGWRTLLVTVADSDRLADVSELLHTLSLPAADDLAGREHRIEVVYDGADLEHVAAHAGVSTEEVIHRHTASTYTVAFLGFLPGFPYLAGLDPLLNTPRRTTPRTSVPAGAVGIAGDVTGVYPRSSPGGWQIIGKAKVALFDVERNPPALLSPGDVVRFEASA